MYYSEPNRRTKVHVTHPLRGIVFLIVLAFLTGLALKYIPCIGVLMLCYTAFVAVIVSLIAGTALNMLFSGDPYYIVKVGAHTYYMSNYQLSEEDIEKAKRKPKTTTHSLTWRS